MTGGALSVQRQANPIRIVLNADDFGLSAGIDQGILDLLANGRLTGVSAMTTGPRWSEDGPNLAAYRTAADIGLHFSLTEVPTFRSEGLRRSDGAPFTFSEVVDVAWWRRIDRAAVRDELLRQWRAFIDILGQSPAHLDSHQHVHQLPVVRDAVLEFLDDLSESERPYVRTAVERTGTIVRRRVHAARALAFSVAGRRLRRGLAARRIRTNDGFSGIYDFRATAGYRPLFRKFLRETRNTAIVLCHPAAPGMTMPGDRIAGARGSEYDYFAGDALAEDLAAAGVTIGRFADS